MKTILGILSGVLAAFSLFTFPAHAQAPSSIVGTSFGVGIASGTVPFASSGYYIFLPASSGSSYQVIGIYNVANSGGTYAYTRNSSTAATVNLSDSINGALLGIMGFNTSTSGTFYVTASAAPGAYQNGDFDMFAGKVPSSIAGKTIRCYVSDGLNPFANTGTFTLMVAASGTTYTVVGDGVSTANSSGTCSYSVINAPTGQLQINDSVLGSSIVYLAYSTGSTGGYAAKSTSSGGFQIGDFVVLDTTPPTLTITSPTSGQRWSNSVFTVKGTAEDDVKVAQVYYQNNGTGWSTASTANNWSNWTGIVTLVPGTNVIQAYAQDTSGNLSSTNANALDYVVTAVAVVQITGVGTVSPNYNGQKLELGRNYSMTATPGAGFAFSNWTGSVTSSSATLNFMMITNLTVTASFVDVAQPTVAITSPTSGQRLGNAAVTIKGTASDNSKVAGVFYQLNNDVWATPTTSNGFTNWTALALLVAGTNTVSAYAVDLAGNVSATNAVSFFSTNAFMMNLSFLSAQPLKTNGLALVLNTATGLTCRIDFSTNLVNWVTLTNLLTTNPATPFRDGAAALSNRRFYRAVLPFP